ncbi:hypothetical protein B4U79_00758 [Dinothrombium tinctorium]|uniref:PLD phosphodiesterase domain-containing protein n=1 Tax=Dinothrombium tinctorium TaxID=1965070 RepID=A0A443Q9P6_9ACAR|nr:hypothetical protein B4U79_00758 [Dinothrombium tinctorium]
MINGAKQSIEISALYWTLLCEDVLQQRVGGCEKGEAILKALLNAARRNVTIRIATNYNKQNMSSSADLQMLHSAGAELRFVDFTRLVGAGVLHTKFIIADNRTFYIGSSNMDWRSLTQVKELGVFVADCPLLARDLHKIFQVYWILGNASAKIPEKWPDYLATNINVENPLSLDLGVNPASVYISSSPKQFNPTNRTNDIDALLNVINSAKKFIYISVMDYSPVFLYQQPNKYWPVIDDALKRVVIEKGVSVKLLISHWKQTPTNMMVFLQSLAAFYKYQNAGRIDVKIFTVPPLPNIEIPFARVNHNKYMVTDEHAFIGTSNWSADYFVNTGGVSLVVKNGFTNKNDIRSQLEQLFLRDWNSNYTSSLTKSNYYYEFLIKQK